MISQRTVDWILFLLRVYLNNWQRPISTCKTKCVWLIWTAKLTWKEKKLNQFHIWKNQILSHWQIKSMLTSQNSEKRLLDMSLLFRISSFRQRNRSGSNLSFKKINSKTSLVFWTSGIPKTKKSSILWCQPTSKKVFGLIIQTDINSLATRSKYLTLSK